MSARIFEGFDVEKENPVCEACHRADPRRWTCRMCGVAVCGHKCGRQFLDGGCFCRVCERWYESEEQIRARAADLERRLQARGYGVSHHDTSSSVRELL